MKHVALFISVVILCLVAVVATAEVMPLPDLSETPAATDVPEVQMTVSFGKVEVPVDATYVDLGDQKVTNYDALCAFLDQLPNLQYFDMYETLIKRPQIERLAARYPNVRFGWTITFTCNNKKHALRTDATAWSTLHNNKSTHHTSEDFSVLKYCWNLQALDIGHNGVDDLSFLYDLPNLKVLIVACNYITDITPIGSLTQLQYLELFKNKVTDLSPLANCTELIDLNICFNRVKDWSPIMNLPRIERLWVYNSNNYSDSSPVPTAVVNELRAAYPNAEVDWKHYSTAGTWRTHERYYIINEMFTTASYIPFN